MPSKNFREFTNGKMVGGFIVTCKIEWNRWEWGLLLFALLCARALRYHNNQVYNNFTPTHTITHFAILAFVTKDTDFINASDSWDKLSVLMIYTTITVEIISNWPAVDSRRCWCCLLLLLLLCICISAALLLKCICIICIQIVLVLTIDEWMLKMNERCVLFTFCPRALDDLFAQPFEMDNVLRRNNFRIV